MEAQLLIDEAVRLPAQDRARIVDSLLRSLDPPSPEIEGKWLDEAARRLDQLRNGSVKAVAAPDLFAEMAKRLGR